MDNKELTRTLTHLILSYCVLLAAFTLFGSIYAKLLFPLFRGEINSLSSVVEVVSIGFEDYQDQQLISLVVRFVDLETAPPMFLRWPPMNLYIHPIIVFTILSAWPGIILKERMKLFAISLPILLIVEMLDMPLIALTRISAHAHHLLSGTGTPPALTQSYWLSFLSNGGREFLSICAALLSLAGFYLLKLRGVAEPDRNAPCPCGSGKKYKRCCRVR